jgi:GTPase SAR1 family protein
VHACASIAHLLLEYASECVCATILRVDPTQAYAMFSRRILQHHVAHGFRWARTTGKRTPSFRVDAAYKTPVSHSEKCTVGPAACLGGATGQPCQHRLEERVRKKINTAHVNPGGPIECACEAWAAAMQRLHPRGELTLTNCDPTRWATSPWEVAKAFVSPLGGFNAADNQPEDRVLAMVSVDDFDPGSLFSLPQHCLAFQDGRLAHLDDTASLTVDIDVGRWQNATHARNRTMHAMAFAHTEFTEMMSAFEALLEDPVLHLPGEPYVDVVVRAQQEITLIRAASTSEFEEMFVSRRASTTDVQDAFHLKGALFAPLRRAKVILCGQGRVGKTSLRKALTGLQFNVDEPSTAGAQVTCALRRVEAEQADGEWSVHDVDRSSWEGQCMSAAEVMYLTQRCGTDAGRWTDSLVQSADHDDLCDLNEALLAGNDVGSASRIVGMDSLEPFPDLSGGDDVDSDGDTRESAAEHFERGTPTTATAPTLYQSSPSLANNDDDCTPSLDEEKEARIAAELAELEASGGDLPIKVSVWDLGGQRLFQALQQLFLTKSAIYVITFCLTHFTAEARDDSEAAAELRFWCDTVASCVLGNDKGEKGKIVVVGTCLDKIEPEAEVDAR